MLLIEAAEAGNEKEVEECAVVFTEHAAKLEEVREPLLIFKRRGNVMAYRGIWNVYACHSSVLFIASYKVVNFLALTFFNPHDQEALQVYNFDAFMRRVCFFLLRKLRIVILFYWNYFSYSMISTNLVALLLSVVTPSYS